MTKNINETMKELAEMTALLEETKALIIVGQFSRQI